MYPHNTPNQQPVNNCGPIRLYIGGAVRDAVGVNAAPGAVAMCDGRVVAAGPVDAVTVSVADAQGGNQQVQRIEMPDRLLIPGLVNAHVHLDLTTVGFRPYGGDFVEWVRMVMAQRRQMDDAAVASAVREGAGQSIAAGVLTVGDIAGAAAAVKSLRASPLRGVSYHEILGMEHMGLAEALNGIKAMLGFAFTSDDQAGVRTGLEIHAPYSCSPVMYECASRVIDTPLATHLAETPEELRFIADGDGPLRALLQSIGKWKDEYAASYGYGKGAHPVSWLADVTADTPQSPWLCAHCNYLEDEHIALLAKRGWSVAYCPRASDYFGHRGHRYRDMVATGVNVCLGTDSIICHGSLSILDEMRRLHHRDGADPALLLKMATVNGMRAMCANATDATFTAGSAPGLVAIQYDAASGDDALRSVLRDKSEPRIEVLEYAR